MPNKIAKFSLGERRLLRRETPVNTETTDWFLLPGTVVSIDACREESLPDGHTRLVYAVFASVVNPNNMQDVNDVRFEMTQRDIHRHTRPEEIQDEPPNRADEQPCDGSATN